MGRPPTNPKIYHILHVDRLQWVVKDGFLWSDASMSTQSGKGSTIGMRKIKERRLQLELDCHPGLHVGECVPFYFSPRSVMLYMLSCANHEDLSYRGGQEPIVHLECDLNAAVQWAESLGLRWAFTLSNAGSKFFDDRCDLGQLGEIDWCAVQATWWRDPTIKDKKQAEFLIEKQFPWTLVERIGVHSVGIAQQTLAFMGEATHRPSVETRLGWYY